MPSEYIAKPDDCISSIADAKGHFWETVWNDPENSGLRDKRKDPNCLVAGDKVHIMDLRKKVVEGGTEKRHRFKRKGVPARLRIQILETNGMPCASRRYRLDIDGHHLVEDTTDGDGYLDTPIPCGARKGVLILDKDDRYEEERYELALGRLDPYSEISGIQERLVNLGAEELKIDGELGPKTIDAVKAFQKANDIPETGELDDQTIDKIHALHGS